jgi:hypothetical protein
MTDFKKFTDEEPKFWTRSFPKTPNKFICYIIDSVTGNSVIPTYVIHTVERPTYVWKDDMRVWNNLSIECYETVGDYIVMKINSAKTFNVSVKELTSMGDIVEEWELIGCRFEKVYPKPLSWERRNGEVLSVRCDIKFTNIRVNTNTERK